MSYEIDEIPESYEEVTEDGGRKYLRKKVVTPPKTPDLVGDARAKQIRSLEEKISKMEKSGQDTTAELNGLRDMIKKLGEIQAPVAIKPGAKPETLLQWISDLCFGPEKSENGK